MHGRLRSWYCGFACSTDEIISLIIPLADLRFAANDIRLMTDEIVTPPRNRPTKENIVSHPCETSLLPLKFRSAGSNEGISSWCSIP